MTPSEAYTSLKFLYRQMMFPKEPGASRMTMAEIDHLDIFFFDEITDPDLEIEAAKQKKEPIKKYINEMF